MRLDASVMLNIIEYADFYLQKQSAEYTRILNISDAVHSIRSLYKLLSSYRDRRIQNTVKHLRFSFLQKEYPNCRCATKNVSGKGVGKRVGVVELGQFDKTFVKHNRKRDPGIIHFEVFSPRYF